VTSSVVGEVVVLSLMFGHGGLSVGKMVVIPPDSSDVLTTDGLSLVKLAELVVILDNLGSEIGHIGSEVGHMGRIVVVCVVVVVVADVVGQIGLVVVAVVLGVVLVVLVVVLVVTVVIGASIAIEV